MAKNELKTRANDASVKDFIRRVEPPAKRRDCENLLAMMRKTTKSKPRMWGDSIIGFGQYHYKYKSGREGDWFLSGFSPRKQNLTVYVTCGGFSRYQDLLDRLGKHKTSVGCLYIKNLAEVDAAVLQELIARAMADMREMYPES